MSRPSPSQSSGLASSGFETSVLSSPEVGYQKTNSKRQGILGAPFKRRGILQSSSDSSGIDDDSESPANDQTPALSHSLQSLDSEYAIPHSLSPPIPTSADSQGLQPNYFLYGFLSAREKEKQEESRRMADFLTCCERGNLSQSHIKRLLQTDVVNSLESYDTLKAHIYSRSRVKKRFAIMCPLEHMAYESSGSGSECKTSSCEQTVSSANMYWYRYVSEMVKALCREEDSFRDLMAGCQEAQRAVVERKVDVMFDYYDGDLFRGKYDSMLEGWDEQKELHVFLTFSSDGFEEFATRSGTRSAWPVVFIVLNYPVCQRFKAGNVLIASSIPGSHDSKHFNTFLSPIVLDLQDAERGTEVMCRDGIVRTIFIHVLFATFDYPAASKCLGFSGHNATFFCRSCHKTLQNVPEAGGRYAIPAESKTIRANAISGRKKIAP